MVTYYKPSQWRGKHIVYRTTDPDAPKRELIEGAIFLVMAGIGMVAFVLLSRWLR